MRAGHPCRQGFGWRKRGRATLVSCKERKSRFLLLARAQNKTASGEALLPCLRELPHLAVPTDALGGKAFPAGAEAGFPGVLTYLSDLLAYLCRPIHPGSAAPKGMAMPFATVFSRGHQFSQDHGGGAAERSRVAERSAATACCRYNLLWGSGRRIWCACRGTLPCFFSRSERAAGLQ